MKNTDSRIVEFSEWRKVSDLPANDPLQKALDDKHSPTGVYQVAELSVIEKIADSIVHEDIGYTGMSQSIHSRTYSIRQPRGSHGAAVFIRENNLDRDKVMIRFLYTDPNTNDHVSLENEIHSTSNKMFGKRFKWKEASAGVQGRYTRMIDDAKRLTSQEVLQLKNDLKDIYFELIQKEAVDNWEES